MVRTNKNRRQRVFNEDKITRVVNTSRNSEKIIRVLKQLGYTSRKRYVNRVLKSISFNNNYPLFLFVSDYSEIILKNKGKIREICNITISGKEFNKRYEDLLKKIKSNSLPIRSDYKVKAYKDELYLLISQIYNELSYDRKENEDNFGVNVMNCLECPVLKTYFKIKKDRNDLSVVYREVIPYICPFANELLKMFNGDDYSIDVIYDDEDNVQMIYEFYEKKYNINKKEFIEKLTPKYVIKIYRGDRVYYINENFNSLFQAYMFLVSSYDKIKEKFTNITNIEIIYTIPPANKQNVINIGFKTKYKIINLVKSVLLDELHEVFRKNEVLLEPKSYLIIDTNNETYKEEINTDEVSVDYISAMTDFTFYPLPYPIQNPSDLKMFIENVNKKLYQKFKIHPISEYIYIRKGNFSYKERKYIGYPFLNVDEVANYIMKEIDMKNIRDIREKINKIDMEVKDNKIIEKIINVCENEYEKFE